MAKIYPTKNKKLKTHSGASLLRNMLVAVICLLGMAGSLVMFRRDMEQFIRQQEEEPVGTVYWVSKASQRRSGRHVNWDRLEQYSPIYDGDIVATSAFSELKIRFINGATLELLENSSVQVQYDDGEIPRFELREGEIQLQSGQSGLTVTLAADAADGGRSDLRADLETNTAAVVRAGDDYTLTVYQGLGSLGSGEETREASDGEALVMKKDGQFLVSPELVMLYPRNGTRLLRTSPGSAPVRFEWQRLPSPGTEASPAKNGVILEIAETRDFSELIENWYGENLDFAEIDLPEGSYYWRVFTPPATGEVDSGRLAIVHTPGPRALSPADGSTETVVTGTRDLRFSWAVSAETEAVLLEVADNPEMVRPQLRQLIRRTSGSNGSYVSSGIGPGRWYWRIHPVYPGGVAEGDILSSMSGSGQGFWRVQPVNAEVDEATLPSPVNSFTLAEAPALPGETPAAAPDPNAVPKFSPEPGAAPRIIFPLDNYTLESDRSPDLRFSWKNPLSYHARFQISEYIDFAGALIADEEVFGSGIRSPFLKPGVYYWRVTGEGREGAGSSRPIRLVVDPALASPRLGSPLGDERLLLEDGVPIAFSWERMRYADHYSYNIYLEGRETPLAEISMLQNNNLLVYFDLATSGRFRWTVQGFTFPTPNTTARNGLIAEGRFSIVPPADRPQWAQVSWAIPRIVNIQSYEGEVRAPITLTAPIQGTNIPGIQASRNPPEARWTTEEPLRNVQLIVSNISDPSSDPNAKVKDVSGSSAVFPSLTEGIWYWIIRGDTADERGATPGDPFWFKVLPIPLLPSPAITVPADESIIDLVQLTVDKQITFSWEGVEGANAYIYKLFQADEPPMEILALPAADIRSYVLTDLSRLDEGNYLWQVEAVFIDRDGAVEQRGITEQHRFSLLVPRSDDVRIHSQQGQMFGN